MDFASQRLADYPALTGLRGVAATAVLLFHFWDFLGGPHLTVAGYPLHAIPACGFLGVDLFFVLSGFLLSLPFLAAVRRERPWPNLGTYFVRRARRVLPALWAQIALLAIAGFMVAGQWPFDALTAALHGFFLQHWVAEPGSINAVYWTLPVEWWFYLFLPLAAVAFRWVRWWILLAAVLAGVFVFRLFCHEWLLEGKFGVWEGYQQVVLLRARFDQFFLGMLAAWFHLEYPADEKRRGIVAALAMAAVLALLPSLAARGDLFVKADYPWVLVHYTVFGALIAAGVYGAAGGAKWLERLFANRVALVLGLVSYSLYLWHYPILEWARRAQAFAPEHRLWGPAATMAAIFAVSWLSWRFVESRFLSRG